MEFLLLIILGGVAIHLWTRTDKLEAQVRLLKEWVDELQAQRAQPIQEVAADDAAEEAVTPIVESPPTTIEAEPESEPQPEQAPEIEAAHKVAQAASIAAVQSDERVIEEPAAPEDIEPELPVQTAPGPEPVPAGKFDFEDIFGRLLPIWAGGVTLAVAGFFLVRYSIEVGVLGPKVRVALAFLFGGALLGAAEIAYRQEHRIADPRVRQALAGAGLATLYASFYFAGSFYGFIGSTIAFLGLAGVTGASILLSFRFGMPSAILGLVGGFAAPILVGSDDANLPMLSIFLALVTGGLTYAGNRQGRSWLALAALAGGIGWGALILFSGVTGFTDILAFGGYLVVLGAIIPAFTKGPEAGSDIGPVIRLGAAALAAIQMAAMVQQAGFSMLAWGLYGLLSATLAFFSWREPRLREATAFSAGLAIVMMALWGDASVLSFSIVGIGLAAVFAAIPLANIWRGAHRAIDTYQLSGFSLGLIAVTYGQFAWMGSDNMLALVCLAIAILPALGSWLLWPRTGEEVGREGVVALVASAIGVTFAGLTATPLWMAPMVFSGVALTLIALCWKRDEIALNAVTWIAAAITLVGLVVTPNFEREFEQLFGFAGDVDMLRSSLRWVAALAPFAVLAACRHRTNWTEGAEAVSVLLLYGVFAQLVPADTLAWIAAAGAFVLAMLAQSRLAARIAAAGIALAWAALPIGEWVMHALGSIWGDPMLIASELGWRDIALTMLPALVALGSFLVKPPFEVTKGTKRLAFVITGSVALMTLHMAFKQLFQIETLLAFEQFGFAERTAWQALLLVSGAALMRAIPTAEWAKGVVTALVCATLAHFALHSLGWHNPLWSQQVVGALPIANLLLPSFGLAIAAVILLRHQTVLQEIAKPWLFDAALMALISILAFSELRQVFAGTLLMDGVVSPTEDLLRSLLGIVLAIGFLLWGARKDSRSWRIGSLVLMLVAVFKVFLLDTSGLEGLARIASFVALGFSLIGIGWFYARQLARPGQPEAPIADNN